MITFVDTNVLVRYLTGEPPAHAERATVQLEGPDEISVAPHILAETFYVLTSFYRVKIEVAVDALLLLLGRSNIEVLGIPHEFIVAALEMVKPSSRVSMADALLWAQVRTKSSASTVVTFDRKFPDLDIEVVLL